MHDINNLINRPLITLPDPSERKRLRNLFGVSQQNLANSLCISRKTVANWESGKWDPTGANRENYASVLAAWSATEKESHNERNSNES